MLQRMAGISELEVLDAGLMSMCCSLLKDDPHNTAFQSTMHEDGWHHKRVEGHPKEREDETKDEAHGGVESFPPHSGWSRWHHPEWGNVEGLHQSCRQMPTLCGYKTTGNTLTGGCDPKSGHISVLNQQQWQITRQWCGILLLWLPPFWRWGETRKKKKGDTKPSRYLVTKGLPTVPMKPSRQDWELRVCWYGEISVSPTAFLLGRAALPLQVKPGWYLSPTSKGSGDW